MVPSARPRASPVYLFSSIVAAVAYCFKWLTSNAQDKFGSSRPPPSVNKPAHFAGVFAIEDDPKVKPDKEEERKIQGVLERLRAYGVDTMSEARQEDDSSRSSTSCRASVDAYRRHCAVQAELNGRSVNCSRLMKALVTSCNAMAGTVMGGWMKTSMPWPSFGGD